MIRYAHTNIVARDWRRLARPEPVAFTYGADPEGNIIELQRWDRR